MGLFNPPSVSAGANITLTPSSGVLPVQITAAGGGGGGGVPSGTVFPSTPAAGDVFFRTDRDLFYYYSGATNGWLTVNLYILTVMLAQAGITGSQNITGIPTPYKSTYALFVQDFVISTELINAVGNFTFDLYSFHGTTFTALFTTGSFGTGSNAANTYVNQKQAVNALVPSTEDCFQVNITKVSGTTTCFGGFSISYRLQG